jgi:hypothetical protein
VTTALKRPSQDGQGGGDPAGGRPASWPALPSRSRRSWFARDPAWPIAALLVGWPVWWLLGLAAYMPVILAVPMTYRMYMWRAAGNRRIKVPPKFGLWLLFLVVTLISVTMVSQVAPDTIPTSVSHRAISWALRAVQYLACTVILLYAGNLTERELPRRRLAWLLGLLGIYGIIFGFLDLAGGSLVFTSPLTVLFPGSLQNSDPTIFTMLHPALNQSNTFGTRGRPSAPFTYTNWWGENVAFLLPWVLVAWRDRKTLWQRRQRWFSTAILAVTIIPVVLSFNRGLWVAVLFTACYLVLRTAKHGGVARLAMLLGAFVLIAVVVLVSPLGNLISQRLSSAGSATGRENLAVLVLQSTVDSPMLGYGDTRHERGSAASIAIGRSQSCSACGNADVGVNGQFWLLLYTSGIPSAIFYLGFFGYAAWRYRRDTTAIGLAGELVLLLSFVFMWVYTQLGPPLAFMMLAYALLWKNEREMQRQDTLPEEKAGPGIQPDGWRPQITAGMTTTGMTTTGMTTRGQEG